MPLGTFVSGNSSSCTINIQEVMTPNIILGGMFFMEFYGAFSNMYSMPFAQSVSLFVSQSSIWQPYIGNMQLPVGPSPFPPDTLGFWWIFGICCGGALLLIPVVVLITCYCRKSRTEQEADGIVYGDTQGINETTAYSERLVDQN